MSNLNKNSVTNSIPRVKYQDLGMPLKMICAPNGLLIVANKPVNKIDSVIRQHTNSSYSYEEFEHRSALLGNIKDIAYYSYVVNFKSKNVA